MKVKRINVFQITALLMLTALAMASMAPAGASPAWGWAQGKVHYHCVVNSNRTVSMATHPTDNAITTKTIFYGCQQYSDWVFGTPVGNKVPITIPKGSYYSAPFFLKTIGPSYVWCQVYLVGDGNGTLALAAGALQNVDISITVTGDDGTFSVSTVRSGGSAPAGSCLLTMPLNMSVWLGTSATDPTVKVPLFKMNFPMIVTTGFIKVTIVDTTPYPPGQSHPSMNGYKMNATGVPFNSETGAAVLAGAGAGLDIYGYIPLVGDAYTDYIFTDSEVIEIRTPPVGGVWIPVDKLALMAPYIGLVSTIVLAVAATAVFLKYKKKP